MPRQTTRANVLNARTLRKNRSLPEALLWRELRQSDIKFRQQHPAGPYVIDFYCPPAKTCIEIDGFSHNMGDRPERDERKVAWLEAQGYRVVRIAAKDVLHSPTDVPESIERLCRAVR